MQSVETIDGQFSPKVDVCIAPGNPMQSFETIDGQFSQNVDVCIARRNPMHEVGTQAASWPSGSKAACVSSKELVQLCMFAGFCESLRVGQFLRTWPSRNCPKKLRSSLRKT